MLFSVMSVRLAVITKVPNCPTETLKFILSRWAVVNSQGHTVSKIKVINEICPGERLSSEWD